jgi:hypothetical protein
MSAVQDEAAGVDLEAGLQRTRQAALAVTGSRRPDFERLQRKVRMLEVKAAIGRARGLRRWRGR